MKRRVAAWSCLVVLAAVRSPIAAAPPSVLGSGEETPLLSVPQPSLEPFEAQVQEQLRSERRELDRLLEEPDPADEELLRAFGDMGRLYLLYDLTQPAEACLRNARRLAPADFRWAHYLGYLLHLQGRLEASREQLEAAVRLRPDHAPSWTRLGNVRLELLDLAGAAESFARALELAPEAAAAVYGLGRVALQRGDFAKAVEYGERALVLQPEADVVHHLLGMAHRELGERQLALEHLRRNRNRAVRIEDPLVEGLGAMITGSRVHFQLGTKALGQGDYELAAREFRRAVEIDPADYLALYNLSIALLENGDEAGAEAALRASLEVNPEFRNAHFNLATLAARRGRYPEAAAHFEAAHRIDPEDAVAHLEWATALSRIGQPEAAVAQLEALLRRHPADVQAMLNLGTLQLGLGRAEEAAMSWRRVLALDVEPRQRAEAHLGLGDAAATVGRDDTAVEHYRSAVELEPQLVPALAGLANALGRLGRFAEAAEAFRELTRLAPDDLGAHFGRAMVLILASDYRRARQALEESLDSVSGSLPLQHLLARLLATCPQAEVRDGARALELAAVVFAGEASVDHAETVAMALAELERFDEAIEWQRRVVTEAERRGDASTAERARRRLALYESRQPVRSPWRRAE